MQPFKKLSIQCSWLPAVQLTPSSAVDSQQCSWLLRSKIEIQAALLTSCVHSTLRSTVLCRVLLTQCSAADFPQWSWLWAVQLILCNVLTHSSAVDFPEGSWLLEVQLTTLNSVKFPQCNWLRTVQLTIRSDKTRCVVDSSRVIDCTPFNWLYSV